MATSSKSSSSSSTTNASSSSEDARLRERLAGSRNLFEYLERLPRADRLSLYADEHHGPYACRAVLQSALPELARQYALRLAVCGGAFPLSHVRMWHSAHGADDAAHALRRMRDLSVVEEYEHETHRDNGSGGGGGESGDKGPKRGGKGKKRKGRDDDDAATAAAAGNDDKNKKDAEKDVVVRMVPQFLRGLQTSVSSLRSAPWDGLDLEAQRRACEADPARRHRSPPTEEDLETYTRRRWDSVLHYLVGSEAMEEPPEAVKKFLETTGLMQDDPDWRRPGGGGDRPPLVITSKGYEFMLLDNHVQVWHFMLQLFLTLADQANDLRRETVLFLLSLSYCRVGHAYPQSMLERNRGGAAAGRFYKYIIKIFKQLGLLYVIKLNNEHYFYPTRVAVSLVAGARREDAAVSSSSSSRSSRSKRLRAVDTDSGPSASSVRSLEAALADPTPSNSSHIAIVLQTNFQLCAYTTSPLHVSMLGLFCDVLDYRRLPNVVFYRVTRDSVKDAFRLGVTAAQILRFLKMHAHPRTRASGEAVPANVEDQIWLWDRERRRVVLDEVYIHQCAGRDEFDATEEHARRVGAYAWGNREKHKIYVRYDRAEDVLAHVRLWKGRRVRRRGGDGWE